MYNDFLNYSFGSVIINLLNVEWYKATMQRNNFVEKSVGITFTISYRKYYNFVKTQDTFQYDISIYICRFYRLKS